MKFSRIPLITSLAIAMAGTGMQAHAGLVNITVTSLPDLVTVPGHSAPTPSAPIAEKSTSQGDSQLLGWLEGQNLVSGHPLGPTATKLAEGKSASNIDLSGFIGDYLVVHWGFGPANKFFKNLPQDGDPHGGGFDQAFFIGAGTGTVTLDLPNFTGFYKQGQSVKNGTLSVGGLSFWRVYGSTTNVPDGGMTLVLLGSALSGLALFRRKMA
jgi:hypothetical protein